MCCSLERSVAFAERRTNSGRTSKHDSKDEWRPAARVERRTASVARYFVLLETVDTFLRLGSNIRHSPTPPDNYCSSLHVSETWY